MSISYYQNIILYNLQIFFYLLPLVSLTRSCFASYLFYTLLWFLTYFWISFTAVCLGLVLVKADWVVSTTHLPPVCFLCIWLLLLHQPWNKIICAACLWWWWYLHKNHTLNCLENWCFLSDETDSYCFLFYYFCKFYVRTSSSGEIIKSVVIVGTWFVVKIPVWRLKTNMSPPV